MYRASKRLGVPDNATVLEPGCGRADFITWPQGMRFIGVELDSISGRIAHGPPPRPGHPHRELPRHPPARGRRGDRQRALRRHEARPPRAEVLSARLLLRQVSGRPQARRRAGPGHEHYTLDKQNAAIREYLAEKADFLGAIRLPSDAFKREGTASSRTSCSCASGPSANRPARRSRMAGHAPLTSKDAEVPINRYFLNHPEMVLGTGAGRTRSMAGRLQRHRQRRSGRATPDAVERLAGSCLDIRSNLRHQSERPRPPSRHRHRLNGTSPKAVSLSAMTAHPPDRWTGKAPVVYGGTAPEIRRHA